MIKDRYQFNTYDEHVLNQKEDKRIAERRKARKENATKQAEIKAQKPINVIKTKAKEKSEKRAAKKINFRKLMFFSCAIAAAVVVVLIAEIKLSGLRTQKRNAQQQLEALNEKTQQLQAELQELDSEEYIENAARSELHMIRDGEIMYIVNPGLDEEKEDGSIKAK